MSKFEGNYNALETVKCSVCDKKQMSVSDIIEKTKTEMCDHYCRYPKEPIPEGKSENWLFEDDDSPCMTCPLNNL